MSAKFVVFHPDAVQEAQAALGWYRQRSTLAAEAFLQELDGAIEQIVAAPDRWPSYDFHTRRFLLRRFPYLVVYRETSQTIQVIAVAHGRRRPGYWRDR